MDKDSHILMHSELKDFEVEEADNVSNSELEQREDYLQNANLQGYFGNNNNWDGQSPDLQARQPGQFMISPMEQVELIPRHQVM